MSHRAPILMNKDCETNGNARAQTKKTGHKQEVGMTAWDALKSSYDLLHSSRGFCMQSIIGWLLYELTMKNKKKIPWRHFFISSVKLRKVVGDYQTRIEHALEGTGQKTVESVVEGKICRHGNRYCRFCESGRNSFWILLLSTAGEPQAECWPRQTFKQQSCKLYFAVVHH